MTSSYDATPSLLALITLLMSNQVVVAILLVPLFLILADLATGIASSVKQKAFQLKLLSRFFSNDLLKYIGCFVLITLTWISSGQYAATTLVSTLGMSVLSLSIVASIVENIQELLGASNPIVPQVNQELTTFAGLADDFVNARGPVSPPPSVPQAVVPKTTLVAQSEPDPVTQNRTVMMPAIQGSFQSPYRPVFTAVPDPLRSEQH